MSGRIVVAKFIPELIPPRACSITHDVSLACKFGLRQACSLLKSSDNFSAGCGGFSVLTKTQLLIRENF
jgi:hypothetical protein